MEGEEGIGGPSITPPDDIGARDIADYVDMPLPASARMGGYNPISNVVRPGISVEYLGRNAPIDHKPESGDRDHSGVFGNKYPLGPNWLPT